MDMLTVLADPILPVFAIVAFGYLMGSTQRTSFDEARLINKIAMQVFLPILIFDMIANAPIHEFNAVSIALYLIIEIVVFAIGFYIAKIVFKQDSDHAVLLAFCGIFANNAFYVLPISVLLYGESNVLPVTAVITLDATVTFGGAMIVLQVIKLGKVSTLEVSKTLSKTPILQGIALGIVFSLGQFTIPAPIQTFLDFNGTAAPPLALFALGVVMAHTRFRVDTLVTVFSLLKLILFPALIGVGLYAMNQNDSQGSLYLLASAGPAGAMAFSMALLHGVRTNAIVMIMLWTSVLSLFTLAWLA